MDSENGKVRKKCRVCGDETSVFYNYRGLSCKSCKKFFLRNALKHESFKCRNVGNCRIDQTYRRYCRFCRLNRCIEIGMQKEMISRHGKSNVQNVQNSKCEIVPISPVELQTYEKECLLLLHKAASVFTENANYEVVCQPTDLLLSINIGELFCRQYVEFCKNLPYFKILKQDEQLILLKSAFTDITCMNIAFSYIKEKCCFPFFVDETGQKAYLVPLFKDKKKIGNSALVKFANLMHIELGNDRVIRNLIYAQLLFKERETNNSSLELIRYQHMVYCHLLKRYLQHKYGNYETAETKYASLMNTLKKIVEASNIINEFFKNRLDRTLAAQIFEIIREMYSLL